MMQSIDFVSEIQKRFTPEEVKALVYSLKHDPLLWRGLHNADLWTKLENQRAVRLSDFRAGCLALSAVELEMTAEQLSKLPLVTLPKNLRAKAVGFFEKTVQIQREPASLAEAGLLALALRERRRVVGAWDGLEEELSRKDGQPFRANTWRATFACLFSLIPDGLQFLKVFAEGKKWSPNFDLVSHVLLSNPLPEDERVENFVQMIVDFPLSIQVEWLRQLRLNGERALVEKVALELLKSTPENEYGLSGNMERFVGMEQASSRLVRLEHTAQLHHYANQPQQFSQTSREMKGILHNLDGLLAAKTLEMQVWQDNTESLQKEEARLNVGALPQVIISEVAFLLDEDTEGSSGEGEVLGDAEEFLNALTRIRKSARRENAAEMQGSVKSDIAKIQEALKGGFNRLIYLSSDWDAAGIVADLINLQYFSEAVQIGKAFCEVRPTDIFLILQISMAEEMAGNIEGAIGFARLGIALSPDVPGNHRRMAQLWDLQKCYLCAFDEWSRVIQLCETPGLDDWLGFARAAARSNQPHHVIDGCEKVLLLESENEEGSVLIAQALLDLGRPVEAISYLEKPDFLLRDNEQVWLLLSKAYYEGGNQEKGKEVLCLGAAAMPKAATINYTLGKILVGEGKTEEALAYLESAYKLTPESESILLDFGKVLRQAGKKEDAALLFGGGYQKWPEQSEISYQYAETLIDLGRTEEALPILEHTVKNGGETFERLMLYVDLLLDTYGEEMYHAEVPTSKIARAMEGVNAALKVAPEHLKAKLIRAELLGSAEAGKESWEAYRSIEPEKIIEAKDKELERRYFSGYGIAALKQGQFDASIEALQRALKTNPNDLFLLQSLSEAFLANNMVQEALHMAEQALEKYPDDLKNINWFVEKASLIEEDEAAMIALHHAAELSPENPDIWLKLAAFHHEKGQMVELRNDLDKVVALPHLLPNDLRQASQLFYLLDEKTLALACLERALQNSYEFFAAVTIETACAHIITGNPEIALEILQKAAEQFPTECSVKVFATDIQRSLGYAEIALSSLESIVSAIEGGRASFEGAEGAFALPANLPENWLISLRSTPHIFLRYGLSLRSAGDLKTAKSYLEKALDLLPSHPVIRYCLADLYLGLLLIGEAEELSDYTLGNPSSLELSTFESAASLFQARAVTGLHCLQAEAALLRGEEDLSRQLWASLCESEIRLVRSKALEARLLQRNGQFEEAIKVYQSVAAEFGMVMELPLKGCTNQPIIELDALCSGEEAHWFVEAALELREWGDAIKICTQLIDQRLDEPLSHYLLAKSLVLQAEERYLREELKDLGFLLPEAECVKDEWLRFEQAIQAVRSLSVVQSEEIERWSARGLAVFRPTQQNLENFKKLAQDPGEIAALLLLMRQRNHCNDAVEISAKFPASVAVLLQLALSLAGKDDPQGLEAAKKAVELSPSDPLTLIVYAYLTEINLETRLAYEAVEKTLAFLPDAPGLHAKAAKLAVLNGQREGQLKHWKEARSLQPENIEYLLGLGETLYEIGKAGEAVSQLEEIITLDPENEYGLSLLAKAYFRQGSLQEALKCTDLVLKKNPTNADMVMLAGELSSSRGELEKAFQYGKDFVKLDPQNPRGMLFLANILSLQGKAEDALTVLDHTVRMTGQDVAVLLQRAQLIEKIKGPQVALPYLEDLARMDPENTEVLALLAKTQMVCEQYDKAEETLHQALRVIPESSDLNLMMGRLQRARGQLDKALQFLGMAVQSSPIDVEPFVELANAYQERKEYQTALSLYEQAIKIDPKDDRAYYQSAIVMREIKDFSGAEIMLRKAAQYSPNDLSIRRQLSAIIALNLVHQASEVNS